MYTWFGGKEGLVDAIFIDGFHRFGEAVSLEAATAPTRSRRCAGKGRLWNWALENPTHYMVMFGRAVPDYHPSDEATGGILRDVRTDGRIHHRGHRGGQLAGEPFDIAHHLWACIHGYVTLEVADMDMATSLEQRREWYEAGLAVAVHGCLPER